MVVSENPPGGAWGATVAHRLVVLVPTTKLIHSFIHSSNFISIILKNTQILYEHTKTNYGGAVKRPIRPARTAPKTKH